MHKLIVLPGYCNNLGGTTISLSMMVRGFQQAGLAEQLTVLVRAGSLMEQFMRHAGQGDCLQLIEGETQPQFFQRSLDWVMQQPAAWPLLLENCVSRELLPVLLRAALPLRWSGRSLYHVFRDLAQSHNVAGNLARRLVFWGMAPHLICNSRFTASHIQQWVAGEAHILHPPVDTEQFRSLPDRPLPEALQPLRAAGAKIILTPSRISEAGKVNDKNLRALIPMLAHLKASGQLYHSVIIGQDFSAGQAQTQLLLEQAAAAGVADRLTILPPTFSIQDYYQHADVVVTLAPREPFGRTVVEAIACGVPVIGSCTGGIGEILGHFAPEWTVDPQDPEAAAQAVLQLVADSQTPHRLRQGREWVAAQCSPVEYARRIMQITHLPPQPVSTAVLASAQ